MGQANGQAAGVQSFTRERCKTQRHRQTPWKDRQTIDRQADTQTDRQTDRQADRRMRSFFGVTVGVGATEVAARSLRVI